VKKEGVFTVNSLPYPVYVGNDMWDKIRRLVLPYLRKEGVFLLADQNTEKHCLPILLHFIPELYDAEIFTLKTGESSKNISTLGELWNWLIERNARRGSLVINLGGGVVSDIGGFAAATIKRGIPYINIPTTLIGQADAAIGGKTGINMAGAKNQAGVFHNPEAVFIIPDFLLTLPDRHFKSGFAEIIKCAALSGKSSWTKLHNMSGYSVECLTPLIYDAVRYKSSIVKKDPFDRAERKALNFGHTAGHAIESLFNQHGMTGMLHGEAVASGMIIETFLSGIISGLNEHERDDLISVICKHFDLPVVLDKYHEVLMNLMNLDKKNDADSINFTLLESIGKPVINCKVSANDIMLSFGKLNRLSSYAQNKQR
jgi:3-dehydroquinate synthase